MRIQLLKPPPPPTHTLHTPSLPTRWVGTTLFNFAVQTSPFAYEYLHTSIV